MNASTVSLTQFLSLYLVYALLAGVLAAVAAALDIWIYFRSLNKAHIHIRRNLACLVFITANALSGCVLYLALNSVWLSLIESLFQVDGFIVQQTLAAAFAGIGTPMTLKGRIVAFRQGRQEHPIGIDFFYRWSFSFVVRDLSTKSWNYKCKRSAILADSILMNHQLRHAMQQIDSLAQEQMRDADYEAFNKKLSHIRTGPGYLDNLQRLAAAIRALMDGTSIYDADEVLSRI